MPLTASPASAVSAGSVTSTPPTSTPLPEMSVKMSPFTTESVLPVPYARPAAPRWANTLSLNSTRWPWVTDTLAGSGVQDANGQVPPGVNPHRPWVAQPVGPVIWYPAWISENPVGEDG